MRFRLAGNPAQSDGFARGFQSLFASPLAVAQAAEQGQDADAKRRLMGAQTDQASAHAALFNLQAAGERQQQDRGSVPEMIRTAYLQNGGKLHQADEASQFYQTGQLPGQYVRPADDLGGGPALPAPDYAAPGLQDRVMKSLGLTRQALTVGDKNVENIAKAGAINTLEQRKADLLASGGDATNLARVEYAGSGKAPYSFNEYGVGNNLTGQIDNTGPVATRFGVYRDSETGKNNSQAKAADASAVNSYSSAKLHDAQRGKVGVEVEQLRNAPKGVLVQTENGPVFADPRSGSSVAVQNPDGSPAAPKLKDIPASQNTAMIGNNTTIKNIEDAMDAITQATGIRLDADGKPFRDNSVTPNAPDALGWRNAVLPQGVRQRTDSEGVPVRAKVANIGSAKLHDRSGANVTVSESPRLVPFIPLPDDGPAAALQKLTNLRREAMLENEAMQQIYSREQGYRPSPVASPAAATPAAGPKAGGAPMRLSTNKGEADVQYSRLPSGAEFIAPDGSRRRKP